MTICESEGTKFVVTTSGADVEAGYPEYTDTFSKIKDIPAIVKRASDAGVPPYRLTILEISLDEDGEYAVDNLGSFDNYVDQ